MERRAARMDLEGSPGREIIPGKRTPVFKSAARMERAYDLVAKPGIFPFVIHAPRGTAVIKYLMQRRCQTRRIR